MRVKGLSIGHPSVARIEGKLAYPSCGDGCIIDFSLPVAVEAFRLIDLDSVKPEEFRF